MRAAFLIATALAASLFFTESSLAQSFQCNFNSWRGADTEEIVISWIGWGFVADADRAEVRIRANDGYLPPRNAEIVVSKSFTGFVYYADEKASDGSMHRNRYSFRAYRTGRCEAGVEESGYNPLIATGRLD